MLHHNKYQGAELRLSTVLKVSTLDFSALMFSQQCVGERKAETGRKRKEKGCSS